MWVSKEIGGFMNEYMSRVRDYIALLMTLGMLIFVGCHVTIPDRLWDVYLMIISFFYGSGLKSAESSGKIIDGGASIATKTS